ncbi:alpha-glucosidase [Artomyces pyxidatus]|uniref:Alpha-glucosidase n=1 Tax=Artomyces pyxidatus TaxID=48021 RepID=A0ACB8T0W3_9AGAM|nr:alpha-glucosidase [Artomyces pyxidatus]
MWSTSSRGAAAVLFLVLSAARAEWVDPSILDSCPGYNAVNVKTSAATLTATLVLAGTACNVFGNDTKTLDLAVTYETTTRIHLKITDPTTTRYEVPESVLPRPAADASVRVSDAQIQFNYTTSPFAFNVIRSHTKEVLFSTASHPIIFESQFLRVKTNLPPGANIYGLGEHTETFRLDDANTTRTFWSRDAYGVPEGTNLYSNHPVYFEHRPTGTHGVFLLSSNGMDIKIRNNETTTGATTLEYNVVGGVLDFYFLAGSESDPSEVARQYAQVVGTPAEVPYWSFGLHQCRFGYQNYIDVANVITNYSAANIPLETMWTDIDYMYERRIFTNDPQYFPTSRMREIVSYLHDHNQRYIMMTDPAVAYLPGQGYGPYDRGTALDVWIKAPNGSASLGLVWPGVTVFPDWFSPKIGQYWTNEFQNFYSPKTGFDIDGAWIDMNEPSSFCDYPCDDPFSQAVQQDLPPARTSSPPDPDAPIFGNISFVSRKRAVPNHVGDDLMNPPYQIDNAAGVLSDRTAYANAIHANGLVEYDTHNIFGTMMSVATHDAMLARRPGLRTFVITRSTFAGAGRKVGKWLGDNFSDWDHYRNSIAGMLGMATIYQIPMVGSDICGYAEDTTDLLCARWAMLGAFYPFMRNHNSDTSISQEFYRWPLVAEAAKNVLNIRYRLMDYIYTAFHTASIDGTPVLNPLWFKYPTDSITYPIDLQFFFGDSILVSPVTDENSTSVSFYLPRDRFYDFSTFTPVDGQGAEVTLSNVDFTSIPLHIKGGAVLPLRANGTMTTTELRETDYEFVVAPGSNGQAVGALYIDDGVSITPATSTSVSMAFSGKKLSVSGTFGFHTDVKVASVLFLGVPAAPKTASVLGGGHSNSKPAFSYDASTQVLSVSVGMPLTGGFEVQYQ